MSQSQDDNKSTSGGDLQVPRGLIGRKTQPTGKSARLPSIRTPRDLTLGGIPKKTFIPNIPVRREKSQATVNPVASTSKAAGDATSVKSRTNDRGGKGRFAPNIIQSQSIFEQGPSAQANKFKEERERIERIPSSSSSRSIKRDKVTNNDNSKQVIDDLLRDDFLDDGPETDSLPPIYLPLTIAKNEIKNEMKTEITKIKNEVSDVTMKEECASSVSSHTIAYSSSLDPQIESNQQTKLSCDMLFMNPSKSDFGEVVFVQLPDVLPGLPPSADGDAGSNEIENAMLRLSNLSEFSEGHIGKLRVRASGKTELILGNTQLDVKMGTPCGFLQDVVSIRSDGQGGDSMSVLSHVKHKVICKPNFDFILS